MTEPVPELLKQPAATKQDDGKPPLSRIPRVALEQEALVMAMGDEKYGRANWRKGGGLAWSRLIDAALRHINAFADGENADEESRVSHLAHARASLAFLMVYQDEGLGEDDRIRTVVDKGT